MSTKIEIRFERGDRADAGGTVVGCAHRGAQRLQQQREAVGDVMIVVDHENARGLDVIRRISFVRLGHDHGVAMQRQPNDEFAAFPGAVAIRLQAPAMQKDKLAREREADAQSASRQPSLALRPNEQIEDLRHHFSADAHAIVANA